MTKKKLKKADKETTTVVVNRQNKINEDQFQLDVIEHYRPLEEPMVENRPSYRIQKGAFTKIYMYTRESQAMKKAKYNCVGVVLESAPFYKTEISNELKALSKNLFLKLALDKTSGRACHCILSWVLGL